MASQTFVTLSVLAVLIAATVSSSLKVPLRKPVHNKPAQGGSNSSSCLSKDDVRQIVKEELAASVHTKPTTLPTPPSVSNDTTNDNETFRSTPVVLIDEQGRMFDYDPNEATYRDIPSSMCSASALSASTAANQAAFVSTHNSLRTQLNNCAWKVPKPSTPLGTTTSSTAMAAQADTYTQYLKTNQNCGLVHSSQAQRTQTFKLDNGTQVTNGYIGENLYYQSICLSVGDTTNFNKYQAQYCAPGYLYTQASNSWWSEIAAYSAANNGNFMTQAQLNAATGSNQVGHWTQTAWASSTVIAGAAAECSSVSTQTFTCSPKGVGGCSSSGTMQVNARCFSWVVTGRYYFGGNYVGQNPYSSNGQICAPTSG